MAYELDITDNGEVVATSTTSPSTGKVADLVDLETMKNYLKQGYTGVTIEDTLVKTMIQSARKWIERHIGRSVIEKTIVAYTRDELLEFDLPMPPVSAITLVERIDVEGTATTLTKNTDYYEIGQKDITLQFMSFFGTVGNETAGIRVTYTAKMTDTVDIQQARTACMMIVYENYYNRGNSKSDAVNLIPFDAKQLLYPLKLRRTL